MRSKESIQGLAVYQPGKSIEEVKRERKLERVIKLASNENNLGCSPQVWQALTEVRGRFHLYPEGTAPELRKKLANHLQVDPRCLLFGNGSGEVIQMVARTFLEPGTEAIMADITFPRYETVTRIEGAIPVKVPLTDGVHDLEAMAKAVTNQTRIVWICNPNNPTGTIVRHEAFRQFMNQLPNHVLAVVDEAYAEYVIDSAYPATLSLLDDHPNLVILRTFSKIYGLAAFRIGYGIGHPDVIAAVNRVREPFNVSRLAQQAALAALGDEAFVATCRQQNVRGMQKIAARLEEWGLCYYPAHGNFLFFETTYPAEEAFDYLWHRGVIIRSGQALGHPTYIRVTVGTEMENEQFLEEFASFLRMKGKLKNGCYKVGRGRKAVDV
jgi:histidinol-phosphate aminotransferase